MSEKSGWRGLSDDAARVGFWVTFWGAVVTAVTVGTIYGWWSWYWDVPAELKIGQGAGIVTVSIVLVYALVVTSHNYFGWPQHNPLHQKPIVVEKVVERVVEVERIVERSASSGPIVKAVAPLPDVSLQWYDGESVTVVVTNNGGEAEFIASGQIVSASRDHKKKQPFAAYWQDGPFIGHQRSARIHVASCSHNHLWIAGDHEVTWAKWQAAQFGGTLEVTLKIEVSAEKYPNIRASTILVLTPDFRHQEVKVAEAV